MAHEPEKPVVSFTSVKSVPPLLRTAATRQPRSCSATVTSATKLSSRAKQALRGSHDHALSTSTTLRPLTGRKVVLHRRCGGKCPPPNALPITRGRATPGLAQRRAAQPFRRVDWPVGRRVATPAPMAERPECRESLLPVNRWPELKAMNGGKIDS